VTQAHIQNLKNQFNLNFNYSRNLSKNEMLYLREFLRDKPFVVAECDKNIDISILNHEIYDELCYDHLNDNDIYQEIYESLLLVTNDIIKSTRQFINIKKHN
jgi:hypothetical protein